MSKPKANCQAKLQIVERFVVFCVPSMVHAICIAYYRNYELFCMKLQKLGVILLDYYKIIFEGE